MTKNERIVNDLFVEQMAKNNSVKLDDALPFACSQCGECCSIKGITLSPMDVLLASRHLGIKPEQFINDHCDEYIGVTSRLPVVELRVSQETGRCTLFNGGCSIHPAKPVICAMYPLGRGLNSAGEFNYFHVDPKCGKFAGKQTVRQFLDQSGVLKREDSTRHWLKQIPELEPLFLELWRHPIADDAMALIYSQAASLLYVLYDTSKEPQAHVEANINALKELLIGLLAVIREGAPSWE